MKDLTQLHREWCEASGTLELERLVARWRQELFLGTASLALLENEIQMTEAYISERKAQSKDEDVSG